MATPYETLVNAVAAALRIAEPHMGAHKAVEAIRDAFVRESLRAYDDGHYTRHRTFDDAAELLGMVPL